MNAAPHTIRSADGSTHEFDSVGSVVEYAFSRGAGDMAGNARFADSWLVRYSGESWVAGATEDKVRQWLSTPPADILSAVAGIRDRIAEQVEPPTRKRRKLDRNREDGAELDPQAFIERRADGWTDVRAVRAPKSVVRVAVNLAVSCSRGRDELLYRGAAVVAIADVLSAAGHSVEVMAVHCASRASRGESTQAICVTVKPADAPLDVSSLCTACCEIGFFRYVVLAASARLAVGAVDPGLGYPRRLGSTEAKGMRIDVAVDADVFDRESAIAAVLRAAQFQEAYHGNQ